MFAYIDPGTGSMLFTMILGVATAAFFAVRGLIAKFGVLLKGRGGKKAKDSALDSSCSFVIFSDSKRYWNVFKPICDEFEKRNTSLVYLTMSEDDPALSESGYKYVKCRFIGNGNASFAELNHLRADICLSTTPGLDVYQWKRSKHVKKYVHITHDVCAITAYRMFGVDYYDSILLPNAMMIDELREIEQKRKLPQKEVEIVGSVYVDGLMRQNDSYGGKEAKKDNTRTTVLVAPSWGASCLLNKYGSKFLNALKETGYNIIVRPHPQSFTSDPELMKNLQDEFPVTDSFSWNRDNDNFAVMCRSDILISDFSGIIFDYSLTFGKPVIYAAAELDLAPYDDCWLEGEPWRLRVLPELGKQLDEADFSHLKETIDSVLHSQEYKEKIEAVREAALQHPGEAATRTVDYLIDLQAKVTAQERI